MSAGSSMVPPGLLGAAPKRSPPARASAPASRQSIPRPNGEKRFSLSLFQCLGEQVCRPVDLFIRHCERRCETHHSIAHRVHQQAELARFHDYFRSEVFAEDQGTEQSDAALAGATAPDGRQPPREPLTCALHPLSTGASKTAQVLSEMAVASCRASPDTRKRNPSGSGPNPCWYLSWPVAGREPRVRPWKELWKQRISIRSVWPFTTWKWRATLIIASFDSVPLLQKKARLSVRVCAVSFSARRICGSVT